MNTTRYSAEEIERAQERITQPRWHACRDALRANAEKIFEELRVPEFDAAWYDPATPFEVTYKPFHHYVSRHRPLFSDIVSLLHAGLVFGNDAWRRLAFDVGLGCAEAIDFRITHYDSGMEFGILGRALCDVTLACDDLLSDDERDRSYQQLRLVADSILRCNEVWRTKLSHMAFNNHRICHMGVLLAFGAVLKDDSLIDPAFDENDDRSFVNYLDGAIYDDGLCYESSLKYHYATTAFLVMAARHQQLLLPNRPDLSTLSGANGRTLENYIRGPLATCFQGLEMPRVGDCYGDSTVLAGNEIFMLGYALYSDPIYQKLSFEAEEKAPLAALALGPEEPGGVESLATSRLFPEHGYALLRDDERVHKQIFLTGDRSGIHCQRDGLQLQVELGNKIILTTTDIRPPSQHGFSDEVHERYNRWPHAHSQLTVDWCDQKALASPIPIREWEPEARIKRVAMVDEHADLVDGVHQGRFVSMRDDWICDCVIAASPTERTWRLFYHLPEGGPEVDAPNSALQSKLAATLPNQDPWRAMKAEGGTESLPSHAWASGAAQFALATNEASSMQRFSVPEYLPGRVGLWAEQVGKHAVYVTLMSPNAGYRIANLQVAQLVNEFVARWNVEGAESHRMQARIALPRSL